MLRVLPFKAYIDQGPPPTVAGYVLGIGAIILGHIVLGLLLRWAQGLVAYNATLPAGGLVPLYLSLGLSLAGVGGGLGLWWGIAASWAKQLKLKWIALVPGCFTLLAVGIYAFFTLERSLEGHLLPSPPTASLTDLYVIGWFGLLTFAGAFWLFFLGRALPVRFAAAKPGRGHEKSRPEISERL